MIRTLKAAAATALATMALAACRVSASTPAAVPVPSAPTSAAVNPVTILREMHVPLAPGVSVGQLDIYGDRYASGQFADGEQVTVYTYADITAEGESFQRNGTSTDVNKVLVGIGKLFTVVVTGVDEGGNGIVFPEPVATLAAESGSAVQ